jgi:multiple sugar transport system permease protein
MSDRARTLLSDIDFRHPRTRMAYWVVFLLLLAGAVTAVLPFAWGFFGALKPPDKVFAYPPTFLPYPATRPDMWNWGVYMEVFSGTRFIRYFWNTFLLAVCCWAVALVPSALAGYALSKLQTPFRRILILLFFATLMVPFQAYMVPLYLTVSRLRIPFLGETLTRAFAGFPAVILPAGVSAVNIVLFKSFFDDIPTSLVEAARMDGSSELGILWRVILPLSYSIFAVVSIFSFMGTWNDFLWPLLTISDENWKTIMLRLYQFDQQGDVGKNKVLAAVMIASVPPVLLFALFQKRIMQGIAMVGVKF